jgi:hypothetical protein
MAQGLEGCVKSDSQWVPVAGCLSLISGHWLLVSGHWLLETPDNSVLSYK